MSEVLEAWQETSDCTALETYDYLADFHLMKVTQIQLFWLKKSFVNCQQIDLNTLM